MLKPSLQLKLGQTLTMTPQLQQAIRLLQLPVLDLNAQEPALSTNPANTELLLEDGETIVIGGIIKATTSEGESGIPGLRKIPGLGMLFKFGSKQDVQNELLIFLTPKIVKLEQKEVQSRRF